MAPKPQPTALKVLRGNPGRRPLPKHEPEIPAFSQAEPPAELADDADALKEWARVTPLLCTARVLTEADRAALIALCRQWSVYLEASKQVKLRGMVVKAPKNDYPIVNPYIPIANKALGLCVKLWAEFGLTPSARTHVSALPADSAAADPIHARFFGKRV